MTTLATALALIRIAERAGARLASRCASPCRLRRIRIALRRQRRALMPHADGSQGTPLLPELPHDRQLIMGVYHASVALREAGASQEAIDAIDAIRFRIAALMDGEDRIARRRKRSLVCS